MTGTEKQVEWAKNIMNCWMNSIDKEVASAQDRVKRGTMPQIWEQIVSETACEIREKLNTVTRASIIIDGRQNKPALIMMEIAAQKYAATQHK